MGPSGACLGYIDCARHLLPVLLRYDDETLLECTCVLDTTMEELQWKSKSKARAQNKP